MADSEPTNEQLRAAICYLVAFLAGMAFMAVLAGKWDAAAIIGVATAISAFLCPAIPWGIYEEGT